MQILGRHVNAFWQVLLGKCLPPSVGLERSQSMPPAPAAPPSPSRLLFRDVPFVTRREQPYFSSSPVGPRSERPSPRGILVFLSSRECAWPTHLSPCPGFSSVRGRFSFHGPHFFGPSFISSCPFGSCNSLVLRSPCILPVLPDLRACLFNFPLLHSQAFLSDPLRLGFLGPTVCLGSSWLPGCFLF